jgi:hypothetical protein
MAEGLGATADPDLLRVITLIYREGSHERRINAFSRVAILIYSANNNAGLFFFRDLLVAPRNEHPGCNEYKESDSD